MARSYLPLLVAALALLLCASSVQAQNDTAISCFSDLLQTTDTGGDGTETAAPGKFGGQDALVTFAYTPGEDVCKLSTFTDIAAPPGKTFTFGPLITSVWSSAPAGLVSAVSSIVLTQLSVRQGTQGTRALYVAATVQVTPTQSFAFRLGLSDNRPRLIEFTYPQVVNFNQILAACGLNIQTDLSQYVVLSNPSFRFVPDARVNGTSLGPYVDVDGTELAPNSFLLSANLGLPSLGIPNDSKVSAYLRLKTAPESGVDEAALEWTTNFTPFTGLNLRRLALSIKPTDRLYSGEASGSVVGIPVAITVQIDGTKNGSDSLSFTATTQSVAAKPVVQQLWPSGTIPTTIDDALTGLSLPALDISYASRRLTFIATTVGGSRFVSISDGARMRMLELSISGSKTLTELLTGLGATFPADTGGIITFSNPLVRYVFGNSSIDFQGATYPAGLFLQLGLNIDAINMQNGLVTIAALNNAGGRVENVTIEWTGTLPIVQHVTVTRLAISSFGQVGLVMNAQGVLATVPVSVTATLYNRAQQALGKPPMELTATATDINVGRIISTVWPATPGPIVTILDPIRFARLQITYSRTGGFGIAGTPDLSGVPDLVKVLDFLKLGNDAVQLAVVDGKMSLRVAKTWTFSPGKPFLGPASVGFALALEQLSAGVAISLRANFNSTIVIPIFENPNVNVELGALVQFATGGGLQFGVSAAFRGRMSLKGFPFVELNVLAGSLVVGVSPLSITRASLQVEGRLVQTQITTFLLYDANAGAFGFRLTIDNFSLQDTLAAIGINVNLGVANVQIRNALVQFATVAVREGTVSIPQGFRVKGEFYLFGIKAIVDFSMDPTDGVSFSAVLDFTELNNAIFTAIETGLAALKINLAAIGINIRNIFRVDRIGVDLVLRKSEQSFGFALKMVLLGLNIDFSFNVRSTGASFMTDAIFGKVKEFFTAACTRESYDRGAGTVPTGCASGLEEFSSLCYKPCTQNWQYGVYGKDNICYQRCPPGYDDDDRVGQRGLTCSTVACDAPQIKRALMCYDPCPAGFETDGAALCYEICPVGWSTVLLNCQRWACNGDEDDNGAGLCYKKCNPGFTSDGAALCLGGCNPGYATHPLTCWRGYDTYGKCCRHWWFGCRCCGCDRGDYYDAGCFCARDAHAYGRDSYWRGSRTKLTSYTKASRIPGQKSAIKSFTRLREDRGVGKIKTVCPPGKVNEGGLCYDQCRPGYTSFVTMCLRNCPNQYTNCGTFCVPPGVSCGNFAGATYQSCASRYTRSASAEALPDFYINNTAAGSPIDFVADVELARAQPLEAVERKLRGHLTKPACTTSLKCFCRRVRTGLDFANPWDKDSFIRCAYGRANVVKCLPTFTYDAAQGQCVQSSSSGTPAETAGDACEDRKDGVYAALKDPQNVKSGYLAYYCKDGKTLPDCPAGQFRNDDDLECTTPATGKPPSGGTGPAAIPAGATTSRCRRLGCFCKLRADGNYVDTLAPGYQALKGKGARAAATAAEVAADDGAAPDELASFVTASVPAGAKDRPYATYIQCTGGVAKRIACAADSEFSPANKTCVVMPPTKEGGSKTPDPSCKSLSCICVGVKNGVLLQNPEDPTGGVNCQMQQAIPFSCPTGFAFKAGQGCYSEMKGSPKPGDSDPYGDGSAPKPSPKP
ncbi:hypothetical protein HT031_005200 [Scenedesmus sp. PABB004]|nr:hypothetical protein HT031_005200 [Scenedesmus sp. PABB004]